MNDTHEVARYFCDQTGNKFTPKMFIIQLRIADSLLKVYKKEEIKFAIDYLIKNPPSKGFTSLAYVQYVMNSILIKKKALEERQKSEDAIKYPRSTPEAIQDTDENKTKYTNKGMPTIHGVKKIF